MIEPTTDEIEHGLELLGLVPDPLLRVREAATLAAAAQAMVELRDIARDCRRLQARRLHPDLVGADAEREAELRAILAAGAWIDELRVRDVWEPPGRRRQLAAGAVDVGLRGMRFTITAAWRPGRRSW